MNIHTVKTIYFGNQLILQMTQKSNYTSVLTDEHCRNFITEHCGPQLNKMLSPKGPFFSFVGTFAENI